MIGPEHIAQYEDREIFNPQKEISILVITMINAKRKNSMCSEKVGMHK